MTKINIQLNDVSINMLFNNVSTSSLSFFKTSDIVIQHVDFGDK